MKTVALLLLSFVLSNTICQAQNPYWMIAPKYLNFNSSFPNENTLPTSVNGYNGSSARYSQNIQMDADGNILFFIVDDFVYDRNGNIIEGPDGTTLYNLSAFQRVSSIYNFNTEVNMPGSSSETLIIPDKNDCNLFHIISSGHDGFPNNTYVSYGKIKISYVNNQPTPSSCLIPFTHSENGISYTASMQSLEMIIGSSNFEAYNMNHQRSPSLAVVDNGANYTVFYKNLSRIYCLTIDNGQITFNNYISIPTLQMPDRYELEAVKLSNGNYRIATFNRDISSTGIYVLDVSPSFSIVSGSQKDLNYSLSGFTNSTTQHFYGLEFSPDGSRIFTSHLPYGGTNGPTLDYWDISGTPTKTVISTNTEIATSQIELAKDGNMYLPRQNYLAKISSINTTPTINLNGVAISSYNLTSGYLNQQPPMRILQDQIDGSTVYDNIEPSVYHIVSYTITSNTTWDGGSNPIAPGQSVIHVEKELRIQAGVSATLKNLTFKFAPGAKLIVENGAIGSQGGKLVIDNTTLTNYPICGKEDMWLGVEVWGNSTAAQGSILNSSQGVFQMKNNSKIEHAYKGVLLSKRNVPSSPNSIDNTRNGGIAIIQSSEFYNCQYGIHCPNYGVGANNLTTISSTTFRWNGVFKKSTVKPMYHVWLNYCSDVTIRTCNFLQETPLAYSSSPQYGTGIYTINSGFKVYSGCSAFPLPIGQDCPEASVIRSQFTGLDRGVYVVNSNLKPFIVLRNEFTNCRQGIYSVKATNQTISRNKFHVPESTNQTFGVYVLQGTGYKIEENILDEFDVAAIPNGTAETYGIIISNSGDAHNEVYKNTFSNLKVGTQAQGINGNEIGEHNDGTIGLQYKCNEFVAPIYLTDIGVNGIIDKEQGISGGNSLNDARNNAARNTFSMYGESHSTYPDHDIMLYPGSQRIDYVHLVDNSHTPDNYTVLSGGTEVVPQIQVYNGAYVGTGGTNVCPSHYGSIIIFPPLGMLAKSDSLSNIIDGGQTQQLLSSIATNPASSQTYNTLMSIAPYLSDQVLESYLNSGASSLQIKNVLKQCSGLSDYMKERLNHSSLSKMTKNELAAFQTSKSPRQKVFSELKSINNEINTIQKLRIESILMNNENTVSIDDSLEKCLKQCVGIDFKKSLLALYSRKQAKIQFDSLLNSLSSELSPEQTELFSIQYSLDGNMANSLTKNTKTQLQNLSNQQNDLLVAESANILLKVMNEEDLEADILPLMASNKSKSSMISIPTDNDIKSESILIYPNPSQDVIYINYEDMEKTDVTIYDLSGKEVLHQNFANNNNIKLNVSSLKRGTYILKIKANEAQSKTQVIVLE